MHSASGENLQKRVKHTQSGCIISYVFWQLTECWGGCVFSSSMAWGYGLCGVPRARLDPGVDGPGPPSFGGF